MTNIQFLNLYLPFSDFYESHVKFVDALENHCVILDEAFFHVRCDERTTDSHEDLLVGAGFCALDGYETPSHVHDLKNRRHPYVNS